MSKPLDQPKDEDIIRTIERTYAHPDISGWHVREALRMLHARIRHLEQKSAKPR